MKDSTRSLLRLALPFLLLVLAETGWMHALQPLENRLSDFFVRQQAKGLQPDPDIVIVDIDDASLARMQDTAGSWPWPRAVHGELVRGIARQKPQAIVFDILFSERDQYRPESDRLFNEALEASFNVYFPMVRRDEAQDAAGAPLSEVAPLLGLQRTGRAEPVRASRCCRRWRSSRATGAPAPSISWRIATAWDAVTSSTRRRMAG